MYKMYRELQGLLGLISIGLFVAIVLFVIIASAFETWSFNRKTKYMTGIGFERYLISVASVGNKAWYGWRRQETNESISEGALSKMKFKEIKKTYK